MGFVSSCLQIPLGIVFFLIAHILLVFPFSFFFFYKLFLFLWVKLFKRDLSYMTPNDLMSVADTNPKKSQLNLGFVIRLEGAISLSSLKEQFKEKILDDSSFNNFHSYIDSFGGYAFKKKVADLDLEYHIYEVGSIGSGENELEEAVRIFLNCEYKVKRPYWQVALIPSTSNGKNETFIALRIHHALSDGVSLINILHKLINLDNKSQIKLLLKESILQKISLAFKWPLMIKNFIGKLGSVKAPINPSGSSDTKFHLHFTSFELTTIKEIRKKTNVRILSILHTILTGALRRKFLESKKEDELETFIIASTSLPRPNKSKKLMANHWTVGTFKVPLKEENPLERLKLTNNEVEKFEQSGMSIVLSQYLGNIMALLPTSFMKSSASNDMGLRFGFSPVVASLSNKELSYRFLDHEIKNIYPMLISPSTFMGFFVLSVSYGEQMDLMLSGNGEFFKSHKEMDQMSQYMREELHRIHSTC